MNWLAILRAIAPKGRDHILRGVAQAMPGITSEFSINTPLRQAHFLAQLAHESDGFKTATEYASGSAYEFRADLGNTAKGDGARFKGRGLIQLTGRANYAKAGEALGLDLVGNPALAAQFPAAIRAAGWYWAARNLNAKADRDDIRAVTKAINGGYNGLDDRKAYLARSKAALAKVEDLPPEKPKTMATSTEGAAAIVTGAAGSVVVVKEAVNAAKEAQQAASDAWALVASAGPWVGLGVVVVAAAVYLWWRRSQRLEVFGQ